MEPLAHFLREHRTEIVAMWERAARELSSAKHLSRVRLIDFVPALLDRIAIHMEELAAGRETSPEHRAAKKHARDRLEDRYLLEDVVEELAILRRVIVELWGDARDERWILNRAIDRSIADAVVEFTTMENRERDAARRALERSEARLRFLANAGALLSSSLEFQATLDHVAQMVVPEFADWCAVDLVRPDGTLGDFAAVAHQDPAKVRLVRDLRKRFAPRPDASAGVPLVLRTRKTQLVEEADSAWLDEHVPPEQREALQALGVRSFVVVPLEWRERIFGGIVLANAESKRRFTADDLPFVEELARRAASAIDNARLFEEMRRAVELRDRILAVVSHDLRNPLGAIDLGAALLLKSKTIRTDPITRKQAETVQRAAGRMERLIADLLDMSSIQAGRLSLHREDIPIAPLLTEVADAYEPSALEKDIAVVRKLEDHGAVVHCDHDRIIQALSNIIGNAIKFSRAGDTVTISTAKQGGDLQVTVSDTGPGIEPDEAARVFELYWHSKAREHRSTGLGLFIARGIVEAHGGRLWLESTPGSGTTFFVTLPLAS